MGRVGQFVAHLTARVDDAEQSAALTALPPGARAIFAGMPVADRRHALDVAARLVDAGHNDPDLLAAALLHDVGKGERMRVWHRVAGVVLEAVAPRLLERLSSGNPRSWRYPFHLYLRHAELSAEHALAAGCSARAAAFIRGVAAVEDRDRLAALRRADDAS